MTFSPYFHQADCQDIDALLAHLEEQIGASIPVDRLQARVYIILSFAAQYLNHGGRILGAEPAQGETAEALTRLRSCEFGAYPAHVAGLLRAYLEESNRRFQTGEAQKIHQFRRLESEFAVADSFEAELSETTGPALLRTHPQQIARLRGELVWISQLASPNLFERRRREKLLGWVKAGAL